MALARSSLLKLWRPVLSASQVRMAGEYGSGVGSGGGSGGSIRDAGGAFGKMEAAHEEQYFRQLQAEQLKALKRHHDEEIEAHESEIRRHEESINRLKKRVSEIDQHKQSKKGKDSDSD